MRDADRDNYGWHSAITSYKQVRGDAAAFSVSASLAPAAVRYIEKQDAHHRRMDFGAELIALLKKHGVEYDPRFVLG